MLLVFLGLLLPVQGLLESMCFSPGYFHLKGSNLSGPRHPGWNRLFPVGDHSWTHFFWGVSNQPSKSASQSPARIKINHNFVKNDKGYTLDGWVHLVISRPAYFHYLAVWARTNHNETYGEFVFDKNVEFVCSSVTSGVYPEARAYIPCSAGPANTASVPNIFIYANLLVDYDSEGNWEQTRVSNIPSAQRTQQISLLWKASTQTYCQRPERIQFIVAASGTNYWEDWNGFWQQTGFPSFIDMSDARKAGPLLYYSEWIHTEFYGHPSRHHVSSKPLHCGGKLTATIGKTRLWVKKTDFQGEGSYWHSSKLWTTGNKPNWENVDVKARSNCKREKPSAKGDQYPFGGRCEVAIKGDKHVISNKNGQLTCLDEKSTVGKDDFVEEYSDHMDRYFERLKSNCECDISVKDPQGQNPTIPILTGPQSRNARDEEFVIAPVHKYEDDPYWCKQSKMSKQQVAKGGICIQSKPGTLVYGVRQWHGVTSLCVTIIITPLSIFIARYYKGDIVIVEGHLPLKGWYIAHVMLAFPAVWMYASGFATMSRQKGVLGVSLTRAARIHRTLGVVTCCLIPVQFFTGFLRPVNIGWRKVFIFVHWVGGIAQHILELVLCITSSQIPASPTQSKSLFSPEFGTLSSSIVACVLIGWAVFNVLLNICLMIRIKVLDRRMGVVGRPIFPIILPLMTTGSREDLEMEPHERDVWIQRGALLVLSMVSILVLVVCVVSLYQSLYDHLYYGFGPMSCTHYKNGSLMHLLKTNVACHR